ncbi:MAG: glucuronate isomerase [Alphaproteobacteria bacterium]|nr:glucuronate isomerase [Alphaproteobacteria bacterium]MDB5741183.1 glucuronate isomerase [Alphaproteobacteria bacterium]
MALRLDPDRYFPADTVQRALARELFAGIEKLPVISPHGHTDPAWFAHDEPFEDAVSLLLWPDHYLLRLLYSQGVTLESIGLAPRDGSDAVVETNRRKIWRLFAEKYYIFRGTPCRAWLDHTFLEVFGLDRPFTPQTADHYFDFIGEKLATPAFRPRTLFERFNLEAIATTEHSLDLLKDHEAIAASGWNGRVLTTFRPDEVTDPDHEIFAPSLKKLGEVTGEDTGTWKGYLRALENRRAFFRAHGATATDHGHATAQTADLSATEAEALFAKVSAGRADPAARELFRGQMLTEMARMSVEDGMVMQIHPGCWRNHNALLYRRHGKNVGGDMPAVGAFMGQLKPLLDRFGNRSDFTLLLFTLDETTYSRELSPLAGHYPCLKLGPAWWFHDSPEGMMRYRRQTTESAGFYNTAGFNDDTRAFFSIPARHDMARRIDCAYLAELVAQGRLPLDESHEVARDLTYNLPKKVYKL